MHIDLFGSSGVCGECHVKLIDISSSNLHIFLRWMRYDVNGKVVNIPLKSVRNDEFEVLFH